MSVAIRFENVSKRYKLGVRGGGSLREAASDLFRRMLGRKENPADDSKYIWALKDVSFEVEEGEALGIIGPNGAGKTTILKLLSNITKPTSGNIKIKGRVSSLIELGAGFHQDLTGRENIYLNGSILGLRKKEIDEKFDSIVRFAELEQFIDTPVKRYSSGMYVRLGFAIAAHVDPDILLVDEVLAVGDMAFRRKCLNRMANLRREGKTIVFVSHNLTMVQRLCQRVIWLNNGQIQALGNATEVIKKYTDAENRRALNSDRQERVSKRITGDVIITQVRLLDFDGNLRDSFVTKEGIIIEVEYQVRRQIADPNIGVSIWTDDGVRVSYSDIKLQGYSLSMEPGRGIARYIIPSLPLLPGAYSVTVGISDGIVQCDLRQSVAMFTVKTQGDSGYAASLTRELYGLVDLNGTWEV